MLQFHGIHVALCLFVSLVALGCSSSKSGVPISGEVTFQGQPIIDGEIVFTPASGAAASVAGKIKEGKYECRVPEGRSQVRITAYREVPGKVDRSNPGEQSPLVEMYIPPQFNAQTKLEVSVDNSSNKHNFPLGSS